MTKVKQSKQPKTLTREQQLEKENKLLRIEIEYLKKVSRSWDCTLESNNQIKTKIIEELTDDFDLSDILKVTKFPKLTYYYWVKKMA